MEHATFLTHQTVLCCSKSSWVYTEAALQINNRKVLSHLSKITGFFIIDPGSLISLWVGYNYDWTMFYNAVVL
jgi:hypothetical protein